MERIVKTPGICGGDARVCGARIPVWGLVRAREGGWTDAEILRAYPHLTPEDLQAAWEYLAENEAEIRRAINENARE